MYKGTSASAGIGIGKAVIVEEAELVITRQAVSDGEAEIPVSYTHLTLPTILLV